jgi:hypothetical protein
LERSPKENWVERVGGLPRYIERIAKHLHYEKGKTISNAIAIAVNVVKKMCATGDLNFPGKQSANPKSRAQACAAVAEWEAKKARSKAKTAGRRVTESRREVQFARALELTEEAYKPIPPSWNFIDKTLGEIARRDGPGWYEGLAELDEAEDLIDELGIERVVAEELVEFNVLRHLGLPWNPAEHPRARPGRGGGRFISVLGKIEREAHRRPSGAGAGKGGRKLPAAPAAPQAVLPPGQRRWDPNNPNWGQTWFLEKGEPRYDTPSTHMLRVPPHLETGRKRSVEQHFADPRVHPRPAYPTEPGGQEQMFDPGVYSHAAQGGVVRTREQMRLGALSPGTPTGGADALTVDLAIGKVLGQYPNLKDWDLSGPNEVGGKKWWQVHVQFEGGQKATVHVSEDGETSLEAPKAAKAAPTIGKFIPPANAPQYDPEVATATPWAKHPKWEAALKVGDKVDVAWTSSNNSYAAHATVAKINPKSIRVKLDHAVGGAFGPETYPQGHQITVPTFITGTGTGSNMVFPRGQIKGIDDAIAAKPAPAAKVPPSQSGAIKFTPPAPGAKHGTYKFGEPKYAPSTQGGYQATGDTNVVSHMEPGTVFKGADNHLYKLHGDEWMQGKKGKVKAAHLENLDTGTHKNVPYFAIHGKEYEIHAPAGSFTPKPAGEPTSSEDVFNTLLSSVKGQQGSLSSVSGKNVVITGVIPGHTRNEAHALISAAGGTPQSSVTSSTHVLVTGDKVGATKINAAKKKGVTVMSWDEFKGLVEGQVGRDHAQLVSVRARLEEATDGSEIMRLRARRHALEQRIEEAVLTAKAREKIKASDFALPGRRYPIHDIKHARNALARVAQHGTPEEQKKVRAAVKRRYPNIDISEAVLTAAARKKLPKSAFAIPEEEAYPIHDEAHARNALARVTQHGTPEQKRRVRNAVKRRYPHIVAGGETEKKMKAARMSESDVEEAFGLGRLGRGVERSGVRMQRLSTRWDEQLHPRFHGKFAPKPHPMEVKSAAASGRLPRAELRDYSPEAQQAINLAFSRDVSGLGPEKHETLRSVMTPSSGPVTLHRLYPSTSENQSGVTSWTEREQIARGFAGSAGGRIETRTFPKGTPMLPMPRGPFTGEQEVLVDLGGGPRRKKR